MAPGVKESEVFNPRELVRAGRILLLAVVVLGSSMRVARAQGATTGTPSVGFGDGGFFIQSADGESRFAIGAIVQEDARLATDDPPPFVDTFLLRKARPILSARLANVVDFQMMPEFGNGTTTVLDAWMEFRFSPKVRLRTGKSKTPIGYEMLLGDPNLYLPERSLASQLVPSRDLGAQLQGDLGARVSYAGGVFNGIVDGVNSTTDVDTNAAKDLAGRVLVQPFRRAGASPAVANLGFHLGGSVGTQDGALPSYRTSAGQTFFAYAPGTTAAGRRTRVVPAVFYMWKHLATFSELVRTTQDVTRAGVEHRVTATGWGLTAGYMLTGEPATTAGVRPRRPFAPDKGQWGAAQLVARVSTLRGDAGVMPAGLASAASSLDATEVALGLNWFPFSFVKYTAMWERTAFTGAVAAPRPTEHLILLRAQLGF